MIQWNLSNMVTYGLGKSDLNGEVTNRITGRLNSTVEYNLGLSKGDPNGEVNLLVRWP